MHVHSVTLVRHSKPVGKAFLRQLHDFDSIVTQLKFAMVISYDVHHSSIKIKHELCEAMTISSFFQQKT